VLPPFFDLGTRWRWVISFMPRMKCQWHVVFPSMNESSTSNDSEFKIVDGMEDDVMILKRTNNESKNDNWLPWLMKRCKLCWPETQNCFTNCVEPTATSGEGAQPTDYFRFSTLGTWGSSVSTVTRLQAEWSGFNYWWGQWWDFSLHHPVYTSSGAETASCPMGTRAHTLGVKQTKHETNHSPPSKAEVKNEWSYTSTPPIHHGMMLI
jgi:hypothetical protein